MEKEYYKNLIVQDIEKRKDIDTSKIEEKFKALLERNSEFLKKHLEIPIEAHILVRDLFGIDYTNQDAEDYEYIFSKIPGIGKKEIITPEEEKYSLYPWTSSKIILDYIFNNASLNDIETLVKDLKPFFLGNNEELNKRKFCSENMKIIRLLDYCLDNKKYLEFGVISERLELRFLELYFEINKEKIKNMLQKYFNEKNFFSLFIHLDKESALKYLPINLIELIKDIEYNDLKILLKNDLLNNKIISSQEFFSRYKSMPYDEQIEVINLLIGLDVDREIINLFRLNINNNIVISNKNVIDYNQIISNLKKLYIEIINSTYYKKFNLSNDSNIKLIKELIDSNSFELIKYYEVILNIYDKCRDYATKSIVDSLYDVSSLTQRVNYMDKDEYNILVRVQTLWDIKDLEESYKKRNFASFSIITQYNFSHYHGDILWGYYDGVTHDMIAHIYPEDSLSNSLGKYSKDLTKKTNLLLDINELNERTYYLNTYNQLCIKTRDKNNEPLHSSCAICTNENELDKLLNRVDKVLVLKRNEKTIENNEDIYKPLK